MALHDLRAGGRRHRVDLCQPVDGVGAFAGRVRAVSEPE
jgi:hypothetical protein